MNTPESKRAWQVFCADGRIDSYLKYKTGRYKQERKAHDHRTSKDEWKDPHQ